MSGKKGWLEKPEKIEKKKVELGRVGRKCIGHWANGIGEEKTVMSRSRRKDRNEENSV